MALEPPWQTEQVAMTQLQSSQMTTRPILLQPEVTSPPLAAVQERILALVVESPGLTIRELTKPLGSSHATVTYHLSILLRKGRLVRERDGRAVRHYMATAGRPSQYLEALYRDSRKRAILLFLASQTTDLSVNQMAQQLGIPFGFLKRTLLALERQGLVKLENRSFRYFVDVQQALRAFLLDA